ncbi:NAD(P)-dependent dehydrogenase (short-subunit alcohol dehydrogenase family) [Aeromonas sp. BIGb0405]|jgi:NAD(P)-dependent dehydrogenase (short-subunit alcohol dehydrogenase family)|uniref:SDR family oxidoreductase n=1 Tax=Aeromonas TaxID=642 RepID=UPI001CCE2A49|nr:MULTISPECIES: SDR family oxidoreductase [Aeromonas]MCS3457844.1 NAD(P)-dependent dehydrogenase (short-subunit alcohol dehydrogenase family) [Aeromonas sp. BIGb0405]UBO73874.1 SDR family oxidoreductase [Aeromonas rivuli]
MYQTVLVTGATSGIGYALVEELTRQGYRVFATGRNQEALTRLKQETGCLGETADLADPVALLALYASAEQALGPIDVLINNAGMNSRKAPLVDTTLEEFDQQYAINLRAPYLLAREALKSMQPRGQGYLINVVSTVAKRSSETMGVYTAMKQGFAGLSQVMMKEAQPHGIKVTTLYPGGTDTSFRAQARPQYMQPASVARTLVQLLSLPDDVVMHEMTFRPQVELE